MQLTTSLVASITSRGGRHLLRAPSPNSADPSSVVLGRAALGAPLREGLDPDGVAVAPPRPHGPLGAAVAWRRTAVVPQTPRVPPTAERCFAGDGCRGAGMSRLLLDVYGAPTLLALLLHYCDYLLSVYG